MMVQEPVRGAHAAEALLGLPGLEQIRRYADRLVAPPPLYHLLGLRVTAGGPGTAQFDLPASPWFASHVGPIPGGLLAVLADGPLGCALQTTLPPGVAYTTAELSMSYLRPAVPDGRRIVSDGRVIHAGRSLGLTEASVRDADGRVLAHSTSRCFIFPARTDVAPPPPPEQWTDPEWETPDPWQRPVEGTVLTAEQLAARSGLACLARMREGLDLAPVDLITGLRVVDVAAERVTVTMPATGWHTSPIGTVEGGFLAFLADAAATLAATTLAPAGAVAAPVDVTVKFVRPVFPDGRPLTAHGRVVNAGRSLVVSAADVVNADGKLVVTAMGSSMLLRGRALGGSYVAPVAVEDESTG